MIKLIVVRHGETIENTQNICQGQMHGTLSEKGIQENDLLAKELTNSSIDYFYSSPLRRAKETAKQIHKFHSNIPFDLDDRLMEWNMGKFQGKPFPNGFSVLDLNEEIESFEEIKKRLNSLLVDLKMNHKNQTILWLTHGLVSKALVHVLENISFQDVDLQGNSSYKIFLIENDTD